MIPASVIGRLAAILYFGLCVAILAFGYVQQDIHDMPIAFAWFMIFLSFPIGLLVGPLFGAGQYAITHALSIPYQPFWDLVPGWVVLSVAGYVQWFVVVPTVVRKLLRAKSGV